MPEVQNAGNTGAVPVGAEAVAEAAGGSVADRLRVEAATIGYDKRTISENLSVVLGSRSHYVMDCQTRGPGGLIRSTGWSIGSWTTTSLFSQSVSITIVTSKIRAGL